MDTIFAHPVALSVIAGFLLVAVTGKIMKASFERIAVWYLYISAFCVIIVMNSIFFPFIGGKDWFFRFATELSLASVVLWWAFEARKGQLMQRVRELFRKPITIAVTAFVAMFELACLFAFDMHAAFWSNFERGEGGFQMLHYYLFFLLLVFLFKEERQWKNFFKMSLIAGGIMILYGIAGNLMLSGFIGPWAGQTTGLPTHWWQLLVDQRFQGSLGNAAYVGAYLLFSMFYIGYLWTSAKIAGTLKKGHIWLYSILLAIAIFFFGLSATRGAFIGLMAGIFAAVVYIVFATKGKVRKWGAVIMMVLILLGLAIYADRKDPLLQKIPEGRLLQISLSDPTAQTRLWVWGEAWQGFLERPITGWGPENFTAVYDKFFNPKFYVPGQSSETWFDRAHSIYFDYLSETGLLGFLSYFAIFGVLFVVMFKKFRKDEQARNEQAQGAETALHRHNVALRFQQSLIFAIPIAYLFQGIAIFDVLPMYISTFAMFAFVAYYVSTKGLSHEIKPNA